MSTEYAVLCGSNPSEQGRPCCCSCVIVPVPLQMQNLTFAGENGALLPACRTKHPTEPYKCFMAEHMQDSVTSRFFIFNSKCANRYPAPSPCAAAAITPFASRRHDLWQLSHILRNGEQRWVEQYGRDFLEQFDPVLRNERAGSFVTSCVCHGDRGGVPLEALSRPPCVPPGAEPSAPETHLRARRVLVGVARTRQPHGVRPLRGLGERRRCGFCSPSH